MKKAFKISDSVYWVGGFDWSLKNFHGIATHEGGTYNSYLILDKKVALIDTVRQGFLEEQLERISSVVDPKEIDYVVSNHSEFDHSGSIPEMMQKADGAKLITNEKGRQYLSRMYRSTLPFSTIKDGDELELGRFKLRFIEAPMLHWPETFMTYMTPSNILFSCDLFGAQVANLKIFADLIPNLMEHARRYYALIFRPLAKAVVNGLKKLENSEIKVIAPSHGPVWRSNVSEIMDTYLKWSTNPEKEKAVIFYAGIWGGTEKMAKTIADSLRESGIEVKMYNLVELHWAQSSDLLADLMEAKAIALGSNTILGHPFPTVKVALDLIKLSNPKGKKAVIFGTYGWVGGALKFITNELGNTGISLIEPSIEAQFVPNEEDLEKCVEAGKQLAEKIKSQGGD